MSRPAVARRRESSARLRLVAARAVELRYSEGRCYPDARIWNGRIRHLVRAERPRAADARPAAPPGAGWSRRLRRGRWAFLAAAAPPAARSFALRIRG